MVPNLGRKLQGEGLRLGYSTILLSSEVLNSNWHLAGSSSNSRNMLLNVKRVVVNLTGHATYEARKMRYENKLPRKPRSMCDLIPRIYVG
jgi:hypothetical protein